MAKVKVTETVLRDAHQSLLATRMTTDEMLPILGKMDKVGFYSAEVWGGATFDSCLRFLNEDPWERLRIIRREMPNTKLQMLFRGQNMLGYRHYADDVLEYFVQKSVANGIDIIRIFDALNDIRNLRTAIKAAKKEKAHAQVAISYTLGDVFTDEYYVDYAKQIEAEGADSICIKDMAALLTPYRTATLTKAIKSAVKIPVQLHTHYTSGLASMCLLKGIENGADMIDTAMSPLALGTSHAPTESMVAALQGTEYDTGLDTNLDKDMEAAKHGARKENAGLAETDEDGYMAFSIPWSISFGYGVTMRENTDVKKFNYNTMRYPYKFTQNLNMSGNVRLSDGWNISFSSGYDFENKKISMTMASLSRDLHCFNMSCSVVLAPYTSYNFSFRCNASTLTDALKYDKRSSYSNAVQWY